MQPLLDGGVRSFSALSAEGTRALPLVLVSDDDDDDHREGEGTRRGDDDDDDDDDDEDDCDDDGNDCRSGTSNPAPAGTVAPPQNGLFGNGAPPKAQVN
jgi:hypothetical protein